MNQSLRRYGFATCCVVGPLFFGLVGVLYADRHLAPSQLARDLIYHAARAGDDGAAPSKKTGETTKSVAKSPAAPAASAAAAPAAEKSSGATDTGSAAGAATSPPNTSEHDSEALKFWTVGLQYRGRIDYAVASAFIFLISGAVFLFGVSIVGPKLKLLGTIGVVALFAAIAGFCSGPNFTPPGRMLVVEKLLNTADGFPPYTGVLSDPGDTGNVAIALVSLNTFVSLWSIGIFLWALAVLSLRAEGKELAQEPLQYRLKWLRVALALGSTFLVIGVLAQKALMDWPLSLIDKEQAAGLAMLADALTLQVGAQGTIALIAAFGPAITAWTLDVDAWRRSTKAAAKAAVAEAQSDELVLIAPGLSGDTVYVEVTGSGDERPMQAEAADGGPAQRQSAAEPAADDGLEFAPVSVVASVAAVLAPLLASPFVDALKSVLGAFTKGSP